ncbi:DUF3119 family protein [Oscillatoria sp. FACHB-1407]|uniref:DUF3119 family protein n=1 Tax=Oscillatoria sp. FACHB-1407 TaxID=2692847 RepID=UPI001688E205|nr:DUF3119 family protein [Oscillatoria sp. FACHB-1407]MBD2459940.1 DUF3119 family protein [Oscillatoria sp. FACHB-1407]
MTTTSTSTSVSESVQLAPSYNLPLALVVIGVLVFLWQPWVGGAIALFAVFLLFQAVTLRLIFTPTALDVFRGETLIRRFPYQEWQNWRIFWSPVPILFYFKEVKSIHFLPILFDPKVLRQCLEQRCPSL